jgi:uncharacterized membrane protein
LIGTALYLIGGISFGASIFLVGQMYHVQAHEPLGLLLWAALIAPTALVLRSTPLAALSLMAFSAWVIYEVEFLKLEDVGPLYFAVIGLLGCAFYALGTGFATLLDRAGFGRPMRALGFPLISVGLFALTFGFYELEGRDSWPISIWLMLVAAGCVTLAGSLALVFLSQRATAPWEATALFASAALLLLVLVSCPGSVSTYVIVFNVLLAIVAVGAIVTGYANEQGWLVGAGLVVVVADVFTRYFDFFWHMLPRSFALMGAGVLLLAIALLLGKQRKRLFTKAVAR